VILFSPPLRARRPAIVKQAGFTLIELMVVLVIIAVVTGVTVMSLTSNTQAKINSQKSQLISYLGLVRDQSTFDLKMYLLVPDQQGLIPYDFSRGKWQKSQKIKPLNWKEGLVVDWKLNKRFTQQQNLPKAGWVFWPNGEVLKGKVTFSLLENSNSSGRKYKADEAEQNSVIWNGLLQFEAES